METNNITEIISKRELAKSQIVAETKLPTVGNVTKVLGINTALTLSVTECFSGEVRLSGAESIDIVYATEEGLLGASGGVDFTDRIECDVPASAKTKVEGRVLDTDIVAIEGDGVRLASVIEITVYQLCEMTVPCPEKPQNVYGNEKRVKCSSLAASFCAKSTIESEEMLKADSLLMASGRIQVISAEAALDSVIIVGEIVIDACGRSGDATTSGEIMVSFTEEVAASGARSGDKVACKATICKINSVESDEGYAFNISVQFDGEVYCPTSAEVTTDAFAVDCDIEREVRELALTDIKSSQFLSEKADGSISLDGDSADAILALVGFEFVPENAYPSFGRVTVDGAISGTIVYYDADANTQKSASALIPVKFDTKADAEDGDIIEVSGSVGKIAVKLRRSGEIDIKCDLMLNITVKEERTESVICTLNCGNELGEKRSAISVYVASEGDSLWQCAKTLRVRPESIEMQNPSLEFPLKKGDKIIICANN